MKLIQKVIEKAALAENAAAGATSAGGGAIAGYAMPLFSQLSKRDLPTKIHIKKKPKQVKAKASLKETFYKLSEDQSQISGDTFDTTEVISKLKSLENKSSVNKYETQAFALEDEDGNIVKVRVRVEQGPAFESALNAFLADNDDDTDNKRGVPEIAEILFKLKDRFDIIDVEWPDVPEDQEEGVALGDQGEQQPGAEGTMGAEDPNALDLGAEPLGGEAGAGEGDVKGLLSQVIDMMKADAEARKAEAHARAAEAKAKEADTATKQVFAKVKQEEQLLDMEAHEKKQKDADKEAKRLAKLARWKHEMEQDEGASFEDPNAGVEDLVHGREEEETLKHPAQTKAQPGTKRLSGRVAPADVASYILSRVK